MAALLLLVLALGAVFIAGSRPRLPAPFGPAVNGRVAYATAGDIFTADPVTGSRHRRDHGTGLRLGADPSDGTHIAFMRQVASDSSTARLYVASADGANLSRSRPIPCRTSSELLVLARRPLDRLRGGRPSRRRPTQHLWLATPTAAGIRQPGGRCPSDETVVPAAGRLRDRVCGREPGSDGSYGVYAVNLANGAIRPIVVPVPDDAVEAISVSPDGSRISYALTSLGTPGDRCAGPRRDAGRQDRSHVADASRRRQRRRGELVERQYPARPQSRLCTGRLGQVLAVVPADGSSPGRETAHGLTGFAAWAPDDQSILVAPQSLNGSSTQQLLLDPATMTPSPRLGPQTANPPGSARRAEPIRRQPASGNASPRGSPSGGPAAPRPFHLLPQPSIDAPGDPSYTQSRPDRSELRTDS